MTLGAAEPLRPSLDLDPARTERARILSMETMRLMAVERERRRDVLAKRLSKTASPSSPVE